MSVEFVHLRLRSEYSITDSTVRIEQEKEQEQSLVSTVTKAGHRAVALCDEMNLSGLVQFYQATKTNHIKPIVAADVKVATEQGMVMIPLFVMNNKGYKQLCRILTKACCSGTSPLAVDFEYLANNCSDLIALCGNLKCAIVRHALRDFDTIDKVIQPWLDCFQGRFYLEVQRLGFPNEERWIEKAVNLSEHYKLPLVATNPVQFIKATDWNAHETRVCINRSWSIGGNMIHELYSPNQYYKSTQEMVELFKDLPVAVSNTYRVAQRCNFELSLDIVQLPLFQTPKNINFKEYFEKLSYQGLEKHIKELSIAKKDQQSYYDRLKKEMKIIEDMDYIGYFLIVADFIQWAKNRGILVGPGRGSGAGSLVAFCLFITTIDPLKHGLIFERFLNPERKSMPDFDIDFCKEGREEVIEYVINKYGENQVAQIATFGRLSSRAVVRDVARVQELPYLVGDRVAKLIPNLPDMTLNRALEEVDDLRSAFENDEEVRDIISSSLEIEGLVRNVSKHAAGIVIAPTHLENFCPLYSDGSTTSFFVSQFAKDDVEKMGLVKFDFLGLRTLTVIKCGVEWANHFLDDSQEKVDIDEISYDDATVFELLSRGMTDGIFQLESPGIKRYIKELKPNCLEDLVAMVALYRPGPLNSGMTDRFIKYRNGEENIEVQHPLMEPILKETYGTIVYQEQVMKIAQDVAQYTLGNADSFRKAMGKKDDALMEGQQDKFIEGAIANGLEKETAVAVFDLIKEFSKYGFNKSHSVAYAILCYQTAWLKTHHKGAFYGSLLSSEMDDHERIDNLYRSAVPLGVVFRRVNVNISTYRFTLLDRRTVVWGLGAIKGIGKPIAEMIEQGREDGEYMDFFDFCIRAKAYQIGKRAMEILIYAGAFDCFKQSRVDLLANIEIGRELSQTYTDNRAVGQEDLFTQPNQQPSTPEFVKAENNLSRFVLLEKERKYSGIYLCQSPYDILLGQFKSFGVFSVQWLLERLEQEKETISVQLFAMVEKCRWITRKKNKQSAKEVKRFELRVGDGRSSFVECFIDDEALVNEYSQKNLFSKDCLLILHGVARFNSYNQQVRINISKIESVHGFRNRVLKKVKIRVPQAGLSNIYQLLKQSQDIARFDEQDRCQEVEAIFEFATDKGLVTYASSSLCIGNELTSLLGDFKTIEVDWDY